MIMVYGCACVEDGNGRLLWQKRGDFGWWGLPGGILELHESLPDCVRREVAEETGLHVEPYRVVGVYSSPDFDVTYPNGDQVQQLTITFACRVVGGSLQIDGSETLDAQWFSQEEVTQKSFTTAVWYRAMLHDFYHTTDAQFQHGSAGESRADQPYYKWLRGYIGQEPYVNPASVAFIQNEQGEILLQQRTDNHLWGLPGGGMELGERADQTAVTEVYEETGLHVQVKQLLAVYSDQANWLIYPNGDECKAISLVFRCQVMGGELCLQEEETLALRFFPPNQLPELWPRHARFINDILQNEPQTLFY